MKTIRQTTCMFLLVGLVLLSGCDGGGGDEETGSVSGRVTAADGITPIPGATVRLLEDGEDLRRTPDARSSTLLSKSNADLLQAAGPETTTDANGEYTLSGVPIGPQTLVAIRGAFRAVFDVEVEAGGTTNAPSVPLESVEKLAYVPGRYDSIERIVRDLGNEIEAIGSADLRDPNQLDAYSIVFINCGAFVTPDAQTVQALRGFVEAGGTLYVSDLDAPVVKALFPEEIDFEGDGEEQALEARIISEDLEAFAGKSTVDIVYDLLGWQRIVSVSENAEVLLRGTPNEAEDEEPLAVRFDAGEGRVVYTSFHNEAGVTEDQVVVLRYFVYLPI